MLLLVLLLLLLQLDGDEALLVGGLFAVPLEADGAAAEGPSEAGGGAPQPHGEARCEAPARGGGGAGEGAAQALQHCAALEAVQALQQNGLLGEPRRLRSIQCSSVQFNLFMGLCDKLPLIELYGS